MRLLAIMLLLMLVAPAAAETRLEITNVPADPILPGLESKDLGYALEVDCELGDGVFNQQKVVELGVQPADGVQLSGTFAVILDTTACLQPGGDPLTHEDTLQISLLPDAPGLQPLRSVLTAQADGDDQVATAEFTVQADYVAQIQLVAEGKIQVAQEAADQFVAQFPLTITNFGNAQTIVVFSLDNLDLPPKGGALVPENVVLDAPGGTLTQQTVTTTVILPKDATGQFAFTVVATPSAFADPSKEGTPSNANLLVQIEGAPGGDSNDSPAPAILLAAPFLLAAAALTRRLH